MYSPLVALRPVPVSSKVKPVSVNVNLPDADDSVLLVLAYKTGSLGISLTESNISQLPVASVRPEPV